MNDVKKIKNNVKELYKRNMVELIQSGSALLYKQYLDDGMDRLYALAKILSYGIEFDDLMIGLEKLKVLKI